MYYPKTNEPTWPKKHLFSMQSGLSRVLLACLLALVITTVQAQPPAPARRPVALDASKDQLEYKGLSLHLIPTPQGYYGYEIWSGKKLVHHQVKSPRSTPPPATREVAFGLAKRAADQYLKTGHIAPAIPLHNLTLPKQKP